MKKIIIGLFSLTTILLSYSCEEDELVIEPVLEDIYTGNLNSEEEMLWATNKIYESLASPSVFGANLIIDGDLISDNVFVSTGLTSGYYLTENGMNWSQDSGFAFWRGLYDVIQKANIVILDENVPMSETVKGYKGEAKIARGLAYFYLIQLYASNPTSGQHQEIGVPLVLDKYDPNDFPSRATVTEVYDQIIKDLSEGSNEMPLGTRNSKSYLSPVVGKLLLAKAYLTRGAAGDYDKAIQYSDEVLSYAGSEEFALLTQDQIVSYFTSSQISDYENQPETLYEVEQNVSYAMGLNTHPASFYSNTGAHRGILVRKKVYDLFDTTDERRNLLSTAGVFTTDDPLGAWLRKYPRNVGGNYYGNIKVFRLTEAKYIKMEALAKKGEGSTALSLLNAHAAERGAQPYSGDALTAILTDMQKEFLGEGHRFFDLKRNNLAIDKGTNCGNNCFFEANGRYLVFPISLTERLLNPSLTQHPLWQ